MDHGSSDGNVQIDDGDFTFDNELRKADAEQEKLAIETDESRAKFAETLKDLRIEKLSLEQKRQLCFKLKSHKPRNTNEIPKPNNDRLEQLCRLAMGYEIDNVLNECREKLVRVSTNFLTESDFDLIRKQRAEKSSLGQISTGCDNNKFYEEYKKREAAKQTPESIIVQESLVKSEVNSAQTDVIDNDLPEVPEKRVREMNSEEERQNKNDVRTVNNVDSRNITAEILLESMFSDLDKLAVSDATVDPIAFCDRLKEKFMVRRAQNMAAAPNNQTIFRPNFEVVPNPYVNVGVGGGNNMYPMGQNAFGYTPQHQYFVAMQYQYGNVGQQPQMNPMQLSYQQQIIQQMGMAYNPHLLPNYRNNQ